MDWLKNLDKNIIFYLAHLIYEHKKTPFKKGGFKNKEKRITSLPSFVSIQLKRQDLQELFFQKRYLSS